MYQCYDCGAEFETPEKYPDFCGEYWGTSFTRYYEGCPYCKSGDIPEIKHRCDCCNRNILEGDICYETINGFRFCEECITKKEV